MVEYGEYDPKGAGGRWYIYMEKDFEEIYAMVNSLLAVIHVFMEKLSELRPVIFLQQSSE